MKITALDIRQKTFEKSFRGVDRDEVQAFLTMLSQQWERLGEENRELRVRLDHAQQDVQKLREVESSLYRTLKTAEDTGQTITEQAQREAELRRREAILAAEQIVADARQQARALLDEAQAQAAATVADMQAHVSDLGQACQRLEQQHEGLITDLHRLASEALDKAERARARPAGSGVAQTLARAARVQAGRPTPAAPNASNNAMPSLYNPKPGQQPDPSYDPLVPDIERPGAPAENPGIAPAPSIDQPGPGYVPNPAAPPVTVPGSPPEVQPVGPGLNGARSFFDEI